MKRARKRQRGASTQCIPNQVHHYITLNSPIIKHSKNITQNLLITSRILTISSNNQHKQLVNIPKSNQITSFTWLTTHIQTKKPGLNFAKKFSNSLRSLMNTFLLSRICYCLTASQARMNIVYSSVNSRISPILIWCCTCMLLLVTFQTRKEPWTKQLTVSDSWTCFSFSTSSPMLLSSL